VQHSLAYDGWPSRSIKLCCTAALRSDLQVYADKEKGAADFSTAPFCQSIAF
jgi:hypothetical protein